METWELGLTKRDFPQINFKQEMFNVLMVERILWKIKIIFFKKPTKMSSGYLRHFQKVRWA